VNLPETVYVCPESYNDVLVNKIFVPQTETNNIGKKLKSN